MLDTDISRYIIKKRPESLLKNLEKYSQRICVSVITAAELVFGADRANRPALTSLVRGFLERLSVLDWTSAAVDHYARARTALERSGTPIGSMDLLIAAHALSQNCAIVTNNIKHFTRVPGLKVEVWQ